MNMDFECSEGMNLFSRAAQSGGLRGLVLHRPNLRTQYIGKSVFSIENF